MDHTRSCWSFMGVMLPTGNIALAESRRLLGVVVGFQVSKLIEGAPYGRGAVHDH